MAKLIAFFVSSEFAEKIKSAAATDGYLSTSEFIRDCLREKVEKEAEVK